MPIEEYREDLEEFEQDKKEEEQYSFFDSKNHDKKEKEHEYIINGKESDKQKVDNEKIKRDYIINGKEIKDEKKDHDYIIHGKGTEENELDHQYIITGKELKENKITQNPVKDPQVKNEPQIKTQIKSSATRQKLYNDGKNKECGKCHQIKPYDKFQERMMRGKKTLRSTCRECRNENTQKYLLSNKFKVVTNMYNGKLEGKCQKCNTGVEKLPSLEFHHTIPELKTSKYIKLNRNWEDIKQQVENEKTTIICGNCHSREISHTYNQYKDIIQGKEFGSDATNKEIRTHVESNVSNPADHNRVYQLIKKKEAINQIYGGNCVACENVSADDNLPALHFHHLDGTDPHKGSEVFNAIKNMEFTQMKNQLIDEKCVPICGNCHKMEHASHFKNLYEDIVPPEYWNQIEKYYKKIDTNIKEFKFKGKES